MRYVIVITACAFVLAWDLIYNRGDYIEQGVRMLNHLFRTVGLT